MAEPVSLALARAQCGIVQSDSDFDALLNSYIPAAREQTEKESGHIVMQREMAEVFDGFGCYLELPWRPVLSIDSITYTDADGAEQTFADYTTILGRYPVRIYPAEGASWPATLPNSGVTVTATVGFDDVASEAPALVQAMLLLIAHWFANRETVIVDTISKEIEMAFSSLCGKRRPVF